MHRSILGAALFTLCAWAGPGMARAGVPAACPRSGAPVLERFTPADCPGCWSEAQAAGPGQGWLVDWITPAGSEAEMSAAAPPESAERATRAGLIAATQPRAQALRAASPSIRGLSLRVQSGPAWNGYFGLQLDARGRVPAGATGWLALVELLPAGTDGSAVARELVRTVAGPLSLQSMADKRHVSHLGALRWPETAQPSRLQARAWVESADGRILAMAADRCVA